MIEREFDEDLEECGIEELYGMPALPQTEHLWVLTLRQLKSRLELLHRLAPEEFYHRKELIEKAIRERQDGFKITMPEQTLGELRELLEFIKTLEKKR